MDDELDRMITEAYAWAARVKNDSSLVRRRGNPGSRAEQAIKNRAVQRAVSLGWSYDRIREEIGVSRPTYSRVKARLRNAKVRSAVA
jgi:hypothetical protein